MVPAALPAPPLPPPRVVSLRRIPAAMASSTCPILLVGTRHLSPFVDRTFRHGRKSLSHFRIHLRVGSGVEAKFAVAECRRDFRDGFAFRVAACRRSRAPARAGSGVRALGGNSVSFDDCTRAVEGGGLQDILILVLRNMETRKKRKIESVTWLSVVIGITILVSIWASRSAVGRVFAAATCATMVVAFFLSRLLDDEILQLIGERCQPFYVRAGDQLHAFSEAIAKVAQVPHRFLASRLSFSFPTLEGDCQGDNAGILTSGGSLLIPKARRAFIPRSSTTKSSTLNLALHGKPEMTKVATNISQSIANLIIVITTAELAASYAKSRSRLESGIQDPRGGVQSVEVALPAQPNEFHSKENHTILEAPDSEATVGVFPGNFVGSKGVEELIASNMVECGSSDGNKEDIAPILRSSRLAPDQRTSGQQLSRKYGLVNEAYKTPTFHESSTSTSIPLESTNGSLQVSPPICRISSIPASATQGVMVGNDLPSEELKSNIRRRPPTESGIGAKTSNSEGDDLHLVETNKFLPVTDSQVEDQVPLSNHLRRSIGTQMMEMQRTRSTYPDPWLNDCESRPIEQDWASRSSHKVRNEDGSQVLDLFLVVDEKSKTEMPRRDGNGNGRKVNRNGSIDFWGKNAGIRIRTSEQRGTLTKSNATGKGSSFGSVDDVGDDQSQVRGSRFLEEEQQNLFRRGLSSSSEPGQSWNGKQQTGTSRREFVGGDQRMRRDVDSSPAAGEHGRSEADGNSPQIMIRGIDLEVTKNTPLLSLERWAHEGTSQSSDSAVARGDLMSPAPVGSRVSPPREIVSTLMSNNGPSRSRLGEGHSGQSIGETGVVNERNYSGSRKAWDASPNPEQKVYAVPGDGSRNGRVTQDSSGYIQSQPIDGTGVVNERNDRSRQAWDSSPNTEQKVYAVPGDGSRNGRVTPDSSGYNHSQPEMTRSNLALQRSQTQKFETYLDEAEALVEQGMQGLEGRIEVGVAERMLDEAANLLEKAFEIYPEDLIAVGQWGNSLLVHGQLKLKLSQHLRNVLLSPKSSSPLMRGEGAITDRERESVEVTLQEVCEECEELLVDAGRKFRRALSLDKNDVRALYNWGLALCYRGQLISQEGGERAMEDADKLYLAAIDKFEAILGVSQDHAAGALLNWGLAMLDRSRLREMGDKERVQLLLQAKELFQDAVRVDPNYGQARGAVAVCSAELKELQGFEAFRRQETMERPNRKWWQKEG